MEASAPKPSRVRASAARLPSRHQSSQDSHLSGPEEVNSLAWRNRLTTQRELLPIWDILERIAPDASTRNIQEQIGEVRASVEASEMARRIRLWELTTNFKTDDLLRIVAKKGLGVDSLAPKNQPHLLRRLMDMPWIDLNLTAAQIAQTIHAFAPVDSQHAEGSQEWIDGTAMADRGITALNLVAALLDNWSVNKQIAEAKEALLPIPQDQKASILQKIKQLEKEIAEENDKNQAQESTSRGKEIAFDLKQLSRIKQMMLLQMRLYPDRNVRLRAVLEEAVFKLETTQKTAVASAKRAALMLGVDVTQVILGHVEPSGLASKLVGIAWKTYNAKSKVSGFSEGLQRVQHHRQEKALAKRAFTQLRVRNESPADRALIATVQKVHRAYWSHQTQSLVSDFLVKSMEMASSVLGVSSVLIKILIIIGLIAAAGVTLTTLGYFSLALAGAILLVRLIAHTYKHRQEIALQLKKVFLIVSGAFYKLQMVMGYKKTTSLESLRGRMKKLDQSLANYHLAMKLSGVAPELIGELGEKLAAVQPNKSAGIRKAQLAIQAITGRPAHYLGDPQVQNLDLSPEDIVDRSLVSLIAQLGGFNLAHVKTRSRHEDPEDTEREALVDSGDLVTHHGDRTFGHHDERSFSHHDDRSFGHHDDRSLGHH